MNLFFLKLGLTTEILVKAQGMKAKNRFQFKNKNNLESVYTNLNIDKAKQVIDAIAKNQVSLYLFVSLSLFIINQQSITNQTIIKTTS